MNIKNVAEECVGCGACSQICPKECIEMHYNKEGFIYPRVKEALCINCELCVKSCPALNYTNKAPVLCSYAAINTNSIQRINSSSGGIFPLLAENIIKDGGVVFGAAFTVDCKRVSHLKAATYDELKKVYGSKYLQSNIGSTFLQAKTLLEEGKKVLYSGTPCQINGLKLFLQREYSNLYTVDVICHGVPSPLLWKKYIEEQEKRCNSSIKKVSFRDKRNGWHNYGVYLLDVNGEEIYELKSKNSYMYMFLHNYCLRLSCFMCHSKKCRLSDITLGDFWGVRNVDDQLDDAKGTSAIIVRTNIGKQMIDCIRSNMELREVDYELIVKYNSSEIQSAQKPMERRVFFDDMNRMTFDELQKQYVTISMKQRLKNTLIMHHLI